MIITNKSNLEKYLSEALIFNSNNRLTKEQSIKLAQIGIKSLNFLNKGFGYRELNLYAKQILDNVAYNKLN